MEEPFYMLKGNRTANEPRVHVLVRKSFVFVHSAGMRLAPEILVLEFMREVFFEEHYEEIRKQDLEPDEKNIDNDYTFTNKQRAVLHALRGRRKKSKNSHDQSFFAPAYPNLAKRAWLGKNRERIIYNFLFSGPVSQYLWGKAPNSQEGKDRQKEIASQVCSALLGKKSCLDNDIRGKDFLAATLGPEEFNEYQNLEIALNNMTKKTNHSYTVMLSAKNDELAERITRDLLAICKIEGEIPRMQWLQLFMTFLRFALPMWLLAQMKTTRLLHSWLLDAVDEGNVVDRVTVEDGLATRNKGLLHPTLAITRELFEHVERYIKCRIELSILLYCLEQVRPEQKLSHRKLVRERPGSKEELSIEDLLVLAKDASRDIRNLKRFENVAKGSNVQTFLAREGEMFSAWRNPLRNGQGKNIDEFFRVLYRAEAGDEEGGYLLAPEGRGIKRGFRVFPGQLLLKMITFLADQNKRMDNLSGGVGKLVLQDVERLFDEYGIDFSAAAAARPLLTNELQMMGLLVGSPDAGSSVDVACAYSSKAR